MCKTFGVVFWVKTMAAVYTESGFHSGDFCCTVQGVWGGKAWDVCGVVRMICKDAVLFSKYNLHWDICCLYLRKQLYRMCTSLSLSTLKLYQITGTYRHTKMSLFIIFWCLHFCSNSVALASSWNLLHSSSLITFAEPVCLNYSLTVTKCSCKDVYVPLRDLYVVWWQYFGCGCTLELLF